MKDKISIAFTGDIGFDRYMEGRYDDPELISKELLDFLNEADHVVANVEGPLLDIPENKTTEGTKQLLHSMNPKAVKVLKNIKADVWNLCNNHMMDAGPEGVQASLNEASGAGALTLGAGMNLKQAAEPVFFDEAGGIGLFSVGYRRGCKPADDNRAGCLLWNETDIIRNNINKIKEKCRWCIVIAHGGEEFTSLPSPYTRDRYMSFLEMGADIVVCHHPHVPMNYERVGEKAVFYSLGNFIFDTDYQRAQFNTEKGILLRLNFTADQWDFDAVGVDIVRGEEKIKRGTLPDIFTEVNETEYELLAPLAAKMFVAATKRQQIYLNPSEWADASEEKWAEHFANPKRSGRVEGEALDFFVVCPLAEREKEEAWRKSTLTKVVDYINKQM